MKITGSLLLDRLSDLKKEALNLKDAYEASLKYYESDGEEDRENPLELMEQYNAIELQIAKIEDVQTAYNLMVKVTINGEVMPLHRAVHLYAQSGYVKNQWEKQAKPEKDDSYSYSRGRSKDVEMQKRSISIKDAKPLASVASKIHGAFKGGIRKGNTTPLELATLLRMFDIGGVEESWFAEED